MPYAKEIKKDWYGVKVPGWLRAFDCRGDDFPKAPWGETLYADERALVDLGLKRGRFGTNRAITVTSCLTRLDSRVLSDKELREQVQDMIKAAKTAKQRYLRAARYRKKNGVPDEGMPYYLPIAITLSNFGWSVVSDQLTFLLSR